MGDNAKHALTAQATYIINHLYDGHGSFASKHKLGTNKAKKFGRIDAQAAAIRALYVAYRTTEMPEFLEAANKGFHHMMMNYYIPEKHLFRTKLNDDEAKYTPKNFAIIAGALREASLTGGMSNAAEVYTLLFQMVGNKMQLSEGAASGESGADSDLDGIPFIPEQADNLPPIFASKAEFELEEEDDD